MPKKSATASSTRGRRRSARVQSENKENDSVKEKDSSNAYEDREEVEMKKSDTVQLDSDSEDEDDDQEEGRYEFEGTTYATYQDMVNAKRKRNEEYLKKNGLWNPSQKFREEARQKKEASRNGIKRRKIIANTREPSSRRKSSRLAGTPADGRFVEHEGGGAFVIAGESDSKDGSTKKTLTNSKTQMTTTVKDSYSSYNRGRATEDGVSLSLEEAVLLCDPKWVQETSVDDAKTFHKETLLRFVQHQDSSPIKTNTGSQVKKDNAKSTKSPTSVLQIGAKGGSITNHHFDIDRQSKLIEDLAVDEEELVAKVTPDRIYSVAPHPSRNHLIVAAGDKNGYLGLWNVNGSSGNSSSNDGVHLFRPHTRPVNTLHWTNAGNGLLSASYDGTVRYFDVQHERFDEVFATNEETDNFYTQYLELDHRSSTQDAFFLSTSIGSVMHIDRRIGGSSSTRGINGAGISFHAQLSDKKINSVSLHRDGYCLATAGLDRTVKFWDLRKFGGAKAGSKRTSTSSSMEPTEPKGAFMGEHFNKLSVNSAFFSPSGDYLVTTNMANSLNIYHQAHLELTASKKAKIQPIHTIRHNNNTGRWLTTFMAQWHPELDIFCVGSMAKPRAMDIFDGATGEHLRAVSGEALTAVASRCSFHASTDKIILVGGNSSGRVTVVR